MKLIIDIDDETYEKIKNAEPLKLYCPIESAYNAIKKGTPLPKGHGRLIDADKLLDSDGIIADNRKCHYIPMIDVYQAPTIIEADKEDK